MMFVVPARGGKLFDPNEATQLETTLGALCTPLLSISPTKARFQFHLRKQPKDISARCLTRFQLAAGLNDLNERDKHNLPTQILL